MGPRGGGTQMNGEPTARSEDGEEPSASAFARKGAAKQIRSGFSESLERSLDSTGKALAVIAGLGVFFVATGYFVEWQRFRQGKLPPEEVLPLLPKEQVAAAGVRELMISVLFILLTLGMLGFVFVWIARATKGRKGRFSRGIQAALSNDAGFPTAVVGGLALLLVPFDAAGVLVALIVAGLLFYGLRLIRQFLETSGDGARFPLWRLTLAVAVAAVALSFARLQEFQERRPDAVVLLANGSEIKGQYLASDSAKVLIRQLSSNDASQCDLLKETCIEKCHGDKYCERECRADRQRCDPPRLLVLPAGKVKRIQVTQWQPLLRQEPSLLDHIVDPFVAGFALRCIPPECRWDGEVRIGPSSFF